MPNSSPPSTVARIGICSAGRRMSPAACNPKKPTDWMETASSNASMKRGSRFWNSSRKPQTKQNWPRCSRKPNASPTRRPLNGMVRSRSDE